LAAAERFFPSDHPAAQGHFPGDPIIPGAVLLGEAVSAIAAQTGGQGPVLHVRSVKFLRPTRPGDRVTVDYSRGARGEVRFGCTVEGRTVLTGELGWRDAPGAGERRPGPEWAARPERGNTPAMRFMAWVGMRLGRPVARLLLYPICLYFLAFSAGARAASRGYLARILGRRPTLLHAYRHYLAFASTILDRVFLLHGAYSRFDVRVHGADVVEEMMAGGAGCFLVGAHLGSFEIIRAVGRTRGLPVSMVMYEANARKLGSVLAAVDPRLQTEIIPLGRLDSILKVQAALARGGIVGMLGDRTIGGEKTLSCSFLGAPAAFPTGPLRIAAMLQRPVALMVGLYRGGNRYDVHFERLADLSRVERAQRDRVIGQALERYVGRLEHYCRKAPYNWFNFYEFWR
jgi:predicted LPLAT superfamily acyltransferase